jgi:hypothetical protein
MAGFEVITEDQNGITEFELRFGAVPYEGMAYSLFYLSIVAYHCLVL